MRTQEYQGVSRSIPASTGESKLVLAYTVPHAPGAVASPAYTTPVLPGSNIIPAAQYRHSRAVSLVLALALHTRSQRTAIPAAHKAASPAARPGENEARTRRKTPGEGTVSRCG